MLLLCEVCFAGEESLKNIRVSVQFIEVPHPTLAELLGGEETGGHALHTKAIALSKAGKA